MKHWGCTVDNFTDYTQIYFLNTKNKMTECVESLIKEQKGLDIGTLAKQEVMA